MKAGDRLEVVEGLTAKTRAYPRSMGGRPSRYRSAPQCQHVVVAA